MEAQFIITTRQELIDIIRNVVEAEFRHQAQLTQQTVRNSQPDNTPCHIEEASVITGLSISTIRTKCHLGEMPYHKPRGTKRLLFDRKELASWMASGKAKTFVDLESEVDHYLSSKKARK
jgi:excisionase family DNA binding protein